MKSVPTEDACIYPLLFQYWVTQKVYPNSVKTKQLYEDIIKLKPYLSKHPSSVKFWKDCVSRPRKTPTHFMKECIRLEVEKLKENLNIIKKLEYEIEVAKRHISAIGDKEEIQKYLKKLMEL